MSIKVEINNNKKIQKMLMMEAKKKKKAGDQLLGSCYLYATSRWVYISKLRALEAW